MGAGGQSVSRMLAESLASVAAGWGAGRLALARRPLLDYWRGRRGAATETVHPERCRRTIPDPETGEGCTGVWGPVSCRTQAARVLVADRVTGLGDLRERRSRNGVGADHGAMGFGGIAQPRWGTSPGDTIANVRSIQGSVVSPGYLCASSHATVKSRPATLPTVCRIPKRLG